MNGWRVAYHEDFTADVDPLPANVKKRIGAAIKDRVLKEPERYGEPLRRELAGLWKVRTGDFRIVYEIDAARRVITIWGARHRRHVYPEMGRRWIKRVK